MSTLVASALVSLVYLTGFAVAQDSSKVAVAPSGCWKFKERVFVPGFDADLKPRAMASATSSGTCVSGSAFSVDVALFTSQRAAAATAGLYAEFWQKVGSDEGEIEGYVWLKVRSQVHLESADAKGTSLGGIKFSCPEADLNLLAAAGVVASTSAVVLGTAKAELSLPHGFGSASIEVPITASTGEGMYVKEALDFGWAGPVCPRSTYHSKGIAAVEISADADGGLFHVAVSKSNLAGSTRGHNFLLCHTSCP